jgi:hypothetical protein
VAEPSPLRPFGRSSGDMALGFIGMNLVTRRLSGSGLIATARVCSIAAGNERSPKKYRPVFGIDEIVFASPFLK